MSFQERLSSKQEEAQSSKPNPKNSPMPNTTGENKDDIIFTKDKSPDDLEILE
ncbi:hypothetical protein [Desulfosporosinus sp.]|uniref:hypothetical protein n=1 Tax=Desulfosporosinus sp. TaxID=157907 RepID=UPI0025C24B95|nr:hypothetical protein [Desulfosporosinus sp.]MBC2722842.1 hypothetical protein [Desulfosporosinus sp.]MBC2727653.1 hypothetical protein [Desulfosporosinus sp.]